MSSRAQIFVWVSAPLYAALALFSFRGVVFQGGHEIVARSIYMHEYDYPLQWIYVGLGLALSVAWLWSLASFDDMGLDRTQVFGISALVGLLSCAAYPGVNSNDVLAYVGYGRMLAVHHQNPWMHGYDVINDFYSPYAWYPFAMPYGPLLAPFLAVAGWLSSLSVPLSFYFLKGCWLAAHLAGGWVVADIAERLRGPRRPAPLAAAWTFMTCPLLLVELVNNGHCDGLLVLLLLLSVRALLARDDDVGGCQALVFALGAVLVKPTALLLAAPEVALLARRGRWRPIAAAFLLAGGVAVVLSQTIFASPEARASLTNPHILTNAHSFHSIFIHASHPPKTGDTVAGYLFVYESPPFAALRLAVGAIFGLFCLWRVMTVRTVDDCIREYLWMTLGLMLFYSARVWPWYLSWVLPLAVVTDCAPLRRMIVLWCVTMFAVYAIPFARFWKSLPWHTVRVLLAQGIPVAWLAFDLGRGASRSSPGVFTGPPPAGIL